MKISNTKDYTQFSKVPGNREIYLPHVRALAKSIQKDNQLASNPIHVDEKLRVIDGQHRLAAARLLDIPVYYTITPGASLQTIQTLQIQRKWTMRDFLESYIGLDSDDYSTLKEFVDHYGISVSSGVFLLYGNTARAIKLFMNGEFAVRYLDKASEIMEYVSIFKNYASVPTSILTRPFISAVSILIDKHVPKSTMEAKLAQAGKMIHPDQAGKYYLRQIEDILNWGQKKQIIRLF